MKIRNIKKQTVWSIAFVALVIVMGLGLIVRKKTALGKAPVYGEKPMVVQVATARLGDMDVQRSYVGVLEPAQHVDLSARLTAAIEAVEVDEGDFFQKGALLVRLDDREIKYSLAAMEAKIAEAEAQREANESLVSSLSESVDYWARETGRDRVLLENDYIAGTQAETTSEKLNEVAGKLRSAEKQSGALAKLVESLKNTKKEIESRLSYTRIVSPFEGIVSSRRVDPGDQASPGKILLVVEDRSTLKISFGIPQQDVHELRTGQKVLFSVNGKSRNTYLTTIYPSFDAARVARAEAVLRKDDLLGLRPGEYVPISVILRTLRKVTIAPVSCLVERKQNENYMFVVKNNRLLERPVEVLAASGDEVALTGIEEGELVVSNVFMGWARLSPDKLVEVIQ